MPLGTCRPCLDRGGHVYCVGNRCLRTGHAIQHPSRPGSLSAGHSALQLHRDLTVVSSAPDGGYFHRCVDRCFQRDYAGQSPNSQVADMRGGGFIVVGCLACDVPTAVTKTVMMLCMLKNRMRKKTKGNNCSWMTDAISHDLRERQYTL